MHKLIKTVKDFPQNGVNFKHIGPLLNDPVQFKKCMTEIADSLKDLKIDCIGGIDSRGFIVSTALQFIMELPQFMIRKESKLPGEKLSMSYSMEYGNPKTIEIEIDSVRPGQNVLIVDDLLATGGTIEAAIKLVQMAGGNVCAIACIIGLDGMGTKERLRLLYPKLVVKTYMNYGVTDDIGDTPRFGPKVKEYRPVNHECERHSNTSLLMWHPSLESLAQKMLVYDDMSPSYIDWDNFPDGWCNIKFESGLANKKIVFLMSLAKKEIFMEQLSVLVALPRQLIESLTIIITYLGPATHERVEYAGMLATVEPVLKIISSCIPHTKRGPPVIKIVDIHALPIQFYTNDNVNVKLITAVSLLKKELKSRQTVAFPDEGAYKRFRYYFEDYPVVICGKIRDGNKRKITIQHYINWPSDEEEVKKCHESIIIVDDLVQSGSTIVSCAEALKEEGFKTVNAYVSHVVFPNRTHLDFIEKSKGLVTQFFMTDTNPLVSDMLQGVGPFHVLSVAKLLVEEVISDLGLTHEPVALKVKNVYVSSTNEYKLKAVYNHYNSYDYRYFNSSGMTRVYSVDGISSGIPEQPMGHVETVEGAKNRSKNLCEFLNGENVKYDNVISIENGIVSENDVFYDIVYISSLDKCIGGGQCKIPTEYNKYVQESIDSGQKKTFGSILEEKMGYQKGSWHKHISGVSRDEYIKKVLQKFSIVKI